MTRQNHDHGRETSVADTVAPPAHHQGHGDHGARTAHVAEFRGSLDDAHRGDPDRRGFRDVRVDPRVHDPRYHRYRVGVAGARHGELRLGRSAVSGGRGRRKPFPHPGMMLLIGLAVTVGFVASGSTSRSSAMNWTSGGNWRCWS